MSVPTLRINSLLEKWAANDIPILHFTVTDILLALNIGNDLHNDVFRYLMRFQDIWLTPGQMLLCDENHRNDVFPYMMEIDPDAYYFCSVCMEEIQYKEENLVLVFDFTDEFKQEAKKKYRPLCAS